MDVLFSIVLGHNSIKQIQKLLEQPQPTISTKLMFLRDNKVVIKDKWSYIPNFEEIYKIMWDILKNNSILSKAYSISKGNKKIENVMKNMKTYFPKNRLKAILTTYANFFLFQKHSFTNIVNDYLVGLMSSDIKRVKELDEKLVDVREAISVKILADEVALFEGAERNNLKEK